MNYFNYKEFERTIAEYPFLLGKTICIVLDDDQNHLNTLISKSLYCKNKLNINVIYLCKKDYLIQKFDKKISEVIQGNLINDYLIKEVMNNV